MATNQFATPARPVPGVFPKTPGQQPPIPQPQFQSQATGYQQSSITNTGQVTSQQPQSQLEALKPEQRAAKFINEALADDAQFADIDAYLPPGPSSEYEVQVSETWAPFQKARFYPIPNQVFEQYNRSNLMTLMGIFAELKHAWVSIDNGLYMWDYTATNPELFGFEDQPHSITAVELATPKAGVFLDTVKNVIVLATTTEMTLLGLVTDLVGGAPQLSVVKTGMSTSLRGMDVSVIAHSNATGRVFFGGTTDNELYELLYQQQDGWFRGKCRKYCHSRTTVQSVTVSLPLLSGTASEFMEQIVIDDSRNLIYTLSSRSTIRVFYMKSDGYLALCITKDASDLYSKVSHLVTPNESLNRRIKIVSISVITQQEAGRYSLVATTATGYRIYCSTTSSNYWGATNPGGPVSMEPQHVRIPPSTPTQFASPQVRAHSGSQQAQNPHVPINTLTQTRMAKRFPPGYFFGFTAKDENSPEDALFIACPDAGRVIRPVEMGQLSKSAETAVWIELKSKAEAIGAVVPYAAPSTTPRGFGNDLAVQFDAPIPEVAVLTNTGVYVIRRRRLVDIFASLLRQGSGPEGLQNDINYLMRIYGRTETLSTALAVACGQGVEATSEARPTRILDPEVLEAARKTFIDHGGKPSLNQNLISDRMSDHMPAIDAVRPSPRAAAITLYLSRLLRSTWKSTLAVEQKLKDQYSVQPVVKLDKLRAVQEDLSSLQRFFTTNKSFIKGLSGPDDLPQAGSRDEEIAMQGEHRALHAMVKFVQNTIEGISFVQVLFEERVEDIIPLLPEESGKELFKLTYEELFSTQKGFELAKELVKAIVNRNIAKGSNVETIAESLRRRCGNFCSADDVVIFKAQEQLKRAGEQGADADSARRLLNESLSLFEEVAHSLPRDYLKSAVKQYAELKFFGGAIQLVLKVAHELDKANEAHVWLMEGRPENDKRKEKFEKRQQCYHLIHDIVTAVDKSVEKEPTFIDGRPTATAVRRNEAYGVIASSNDELFLTDLYDWYLSNGWADRVLSTDSPFIVEYLDRKSTDDIVYADLLWRYYGQNNQYQKAASVQLQLAQSGFDLTLDRRIEYLSRARANASTYTQGGNRKTKQKLLQDISELLDIASIQDEILQRLQDEDRLSREDKEQVLQSVDGPILDISTLFNKFADAGGYYDICLMIYSAADHRDPSTIKGTWQQLLATTHKKALQKGAPVPFEAVAEVVRSLGAKLRLAEAIYPIPMLLPILLTYSYDEQRDVAPEHWVIEIFLGLGVAHEQLFDTLETMFYTDEKPFTGKGKNEVVKELLYVVSKWWHDSTRAGMNSAFGGEEGCRRVVEFMDGVQSLGDRSGLTSEVLGMVRGIRARVAEFLE
jgi:nuclear pore complex protein Nup155